MSSLANNSFVCKTNLRKRIFATLVDYSFFILFSLAYIMLFGEKYGGGIKTVYGFMTIPIFVFWVLYFVITEATFSATPGHKLFKLKVLTIDRKEITMKHARMRHCVDMIDIFFYGIPAIIIIKNTDRHQRLGDLLAKTIVVDTKAPDQYPIS